MFSSTTPAQIRDSPINKSTSKCHWSFGKAQRFKDPHPNCPRSSYETKSSLSNKKASFGSGNRSTFFQGRKDTVDPGAYLISSSFNLRKSHDANGYSFTNNRDELSFANYLKQGEKTPAPFQYEQDSNQVKKMRAYSMRPKTSYPKNYFLFSENEQEIKKQEPGPGKYNTIDTVGKFYYTSKTKNSMGSSFIGKQRFVKEKTTPGPGDYNNNTIEPDGRCTLSTMRSSGRRAILQEKRQLTLEGNKYTPGPGTYRQPSDFGHYQNNIRPKTARR